VLLERTCAIKSTALIFPKKAVRQPTCRTQKPQLASWHTCIVPDKKMLGKFVALRSFADNTVVASGMDAGRVMQTAQHKGVESPVVMFIPPKKMVCMY
jgi:hypothetical protein